MRWKFSIGVLFVAFVFVLFLYTYPGDIITGAPVGDGGFIIGGGIVNEDSEPVCSNDIALLYHFNQDSYFGEKRDLVNDFSINTNYARCSPISACPFNNSNGGKFSGAYTYDGVDDNFKVNGFKLPNEGTIEAWVKPITSVNNGATSGQRMIVWGGDAGGDGFGDHNEVHLHYNYTNKKFGFFVKGNSQFGNNNCYIESQSQSQPNNWHHLVATYSRVTRGALAIDRIKCELFVNGGSVASGTGDLYNNLNWANYIYIGRPDNTASQLRKWYGFIDELVIYNTVLTNQEISTNYNSQLEHCPNNAPIGFHDLSNCTTIAGWTCDPDNYTKPLGVHFYINESNREVFIGGINANLPRETAVSNSCGGQRNHGFWFNMSNSLVNIADGKPHKVYAYAINIPLGSNPLLSYSPKTITCEGPPNNPPVLNQDIPDRILIRNDRHQDVFDLDDFFSDPDGDALIYNYTNTTPHIEISIESDGEVDFDVGDFIGIEYIVFTAYDGEVTVESNNVTLNITNQNLPPVIVNKTPTQPSISLLQGQTQLFTINKFDPENNQLFVRWKLNNNTLSGVTGDSYSYNANIVGTHTLIVEVSDGLFDDSFTWGINVAASTQPLPTPTQTAGFCGDGKRGAGEDCSSCPVDVRCSGNSICEKGVCVPIKQEKPQRNIFLTLGLIVLIIFLVAMVALLSYSLIRKKLKKKPQEPKKVDESIGELKVKREVQNIGELEDYVKRALAAGQSKDQLEITLLASGWTKESIDQAFSNTEQPKLLVTGRPKNINALVDYIKKVQQRGYVRQQIEPILIKKGWPKDIVDEVFRKANA